MAIGLVVVLVTRIEDGLNICGREARGVLDASLDDCGDDASEDCEIVGLSDIYPKKEAATRTAFLTLLFNLI